MSDLTPNADCDAPRRGPKRTYRVEDIVTVVGVAYVTATSKAEVKRMVEADEVEFIYDNGADHRRGDGVHVYVSRRPTPPDLTDDGMGNTCSHMSATGVDTTSWADPNKVWRCDHCGLRWVQGPDGTRFTPPEGTAE